ncbi:endoribonuclease YbeY [Alphaproteobacteria bacterium]|nr:endoribonuclease YbeY [Alphaproteobacteria bacterium]
MNLEISVECDGWSRCDVKSITGRCVSAVFSELKLNHYNVEICFLFTDDEELQILNNTYRGINKPTNVLSFPADSIDNASEDYCIDDENDGKHCSNWCVLGSIAMAYETIDRESTEQEKSFDDHLMHLVVHGVLHLLGYDHSDSSDAGQMETLEVEILSGLNVANPY